MFSFFQWFVESGTLDTGQQDEIAAIIKDDIWPNPLKYYQEEVEVGAWLVRISSTSLLAHPGVSV